MKIFNYIKLKIKNKIIKINKKLEKMKIKIMKRIYSKIKKTNKNSKNY